MVIFIFLVDLKVGILIELTISKFH